ncbi:hypothetical protein [Flavobacterium aquariorum]|uniref:hypothetical protein n=1 Tax=Flavobacterium aquariorum TaxID=2217670 RepID=UPI000F50B897|nr:hypothetical protein [Flavobacterium aquariorum]
MSFISTNSKEIPSRLQKAGGKKAGGKKAGGKNQEERIKKKEANRKKADDSEVASCLVMMVSRRK